MPLSASSLTCRLNSDGIIDRHQHARTDEDLAVTHALQKAWQSNKGDATASRVTRGTIRRAAAQRRYS
jgi:hypothetical protein